jgi:hypothetical protein
VTICRRPRPPPRTAAIGPPTSQLMLAAYLVLLVFALCVAMFVVGVCAGVKRTWPVPLLRQLVMQETNPAILTDQFGRLLSYPGKAEIACPAQDEMTAVLLVIGQSNAANYQGQRHQSPDDRVVNFAGGHCYRAASPLLGADSQFGEMWTLLGTKVVQSGLYRTVILIPVAVGGTPVRRWAAGGDLHATMVAAIQEALAHYTITGVLWVQGETDLALGTPQSQYRSNLKSVIDTIRALGVRAPVFITRCSIGGENWSENNPVARGQASLADGEHAIFDGPNTDHDVTVFDRYDGSHFSASGQEKYTDALMSLLREHRGIVKGAD